MRDTGSRTTCCFNEAPIHESGKCHAAIVAQASLPRFNEAPIHESGKYSRPPKAREKVHGLQ